MLAALAEIRRRIELADHSQLGSGWDGELWVDPEAWSEAVNRVREAMVGLHEQARAPGREYAIHVSAITLMFALGPGER